MKKMTQKFIVLAIAVMLLSTVFAVTSNAATATLKDLSVSSVSGKAGATVEVQIKATGDMTVEAGNLLLKFNNKKLKYVDSTKGKIEELSMQIGNREGLGADRPDGFAIAMAAEDDAVTIKKGTVLATVKFEILKDMTEDQTLTLVETARGVETTVATGKVSLAKETPVTSKPAENPVTSKPAEETPTNPISKPIVEQPTTSKPVEENPGTTETPNTQETDKKEEIKKETTKKEKDDSPKTGVASYTAIALLVVVVSAGAIKALKRD